MPLWTILTKWPDPSGPVWTSPPSGGARAASRGLQCSKIASSPPTMSPYPFWSPQTPPLVPASR